MNAYDAHLRVIRGSRLTVDSHHAARRYSVPERVCHLQAEAKEVRQLDAVPGLAGADRARADATRSLTRRITQELAAAVLSAASSATELRFRGSLRSHEQLALPAPPHSPPRHSSQQAPPLPHSRPPLPRPPSSAPLSITHLQATPRFPSWSRNLSSPTSGRHLITCPRRSCATSSFKATLMRLQQLQRLLAYFPRRHPRLPAPRRRHRVTSRLLRLYVRSSGSASIGEEN